VPGLTFARSDYNTPIFSLRGIGFNSAGLSNYPAVTFYVDQAPLVFGVLSANQTFDLQRIEVLKGPQGTLFGQNSTGGAINLVTAKPTKDFESAVSATYGRFNLEEFSGFVSGPLSDTVRARFAVESHLMDPWQREYQTRARNGREEYVTGRGILEWEPNDRFKGTLTISAWQDQSDPQALALAATKFSFPAQLNTPTGLPVLNEPIIPTNPLLAGWGGPVGPSSNAFVAASLPTRLHANKHLTDPVLRLEITPADNLLITSITSDVDFHHSEGLSRSGADVQNEDQTIDQGGVKSFNQELRLENTGATQNHWVVGATYEHSTASNFQLQSYVNNTSAIQTGIYQNTFGNSTDIKNEAIFGNVDFAIVPTLYGKLGARYTNSKNTYTECSTDYGDGNIASLFNFLGKLLGNGTPFTPIGTGPGQCFALNNNLVPGQVFVDTLKENNVSWLAGLDWHATDGVLVYGNISKGYKQGSFPDSTPASWVGLQPVTQESVLSYELGVKSELLEKHLAINAAAFDYDYKNKQIRGSIGDPVFNTLPQLRNVPKSYARGAEIEINAVPFRGLRLSLSAVALDTKITEISPMEFNVVGIRQNMVGAPLPLTSKFSGMADGEYSWQLDSVSPFVGVNVTYQTKQDANLDGSNVAIPTVAGSPPNRYQPGYAYPFVIGAYELLGVRAGIRGPNDRWSAFIWCSNCTNKYYWLNVTVSQDNISRGIGRPEMFGVTVNYKF
jgi:outer membrane receptor protein involved in Fe transport